MILVSLIIVNWNTKEYLLDCLEAISQTGKRDFLEILVIDNHSQDRSADEVRKRFPDVRLIENKENLGFGRATNQGLRMSFGRYPLLLNPDTRLKPGSIDTLLSFMEKHPEAGIAGAQLLNADGSKQNSIANFPTLATELLNKSLMRQLFPEKFPGKKRVYREPIEVESVIGACMMVRKEAIDAVGLLDEDYFLFLEETDWCYRMKKAGWKVYHVPEAEVYHFQGKSAETNIEMAKIEYYRSRYQFFKKHYGILPTTLLAAGLVLKLGMECFLLFVGCVFTFFSVKKWRVRLSIYAHLLWWHLKSCPEGAGLRPKNEIRNPNIETRNKSKFAKLKCL
jgi:GT2 family glycosyltransferase